VAVHKPEYREKIIMNVKNNSIMQRMMAFLTTGMSLVNANKERNK
jgi:hypothetical protein